MPTAEATGTETTGRRARRHHPKARTRPRTRRPTRQRPRQPTNHTAPAQRAHPQTRGKQPPPGTTRATHPRQGKRPQSPRTETAGSRSQQERQRQKPKSKEEQPRERTENQQQRYEKKQHHARKKRKKSRKKTHTQRQPPRQTPPIFEIRDRHERKSPRRRQQHGGGRPGAAHRAGRGLEVKGEEERPDRPRTGRPCGLPTIDKTTMGTFLRRYVRLRPGQGQDDVCPRLVFLYISRARQAPHTAAPATCGGGVTASGGGEPCFFKSAGKRVDFFFCACMQSLARVIL